MFAWLTSFHVSESLGIGVDYLIAAGMVAAGIYLAAMFNLAATNPLSWLLTPLRYVGYALVVAGVAFGYGSFRESVGAAKCESAWKEKNLEQQVATLQRDLAAANLAAGLKAAEADSLAKQKQDSDDQITQWQDYTNSLSSSLSACRRATADDDRRLCAIIGNRAAGCKPAK